MKKLALAAFPLALILASPALAKAVEVKLSSFDFSPKVIHLQGGQPVTLHLVNTSSGGHNFSAPQFFSAGSVRSGPVHNGTVEVPKHGSVDVTIVPARGNYRLRCTHTLHSTFGMTGSIVVG